MSEEFTFDDETKDLLTNSRKPPTRQGRPIKEGSKKDCPVTCYLTREEYDEFMAFLDERPLSLYLRKMILKEIGK